MLNGILVLALASAFTRASPIELTTSRTEAPQVRRSYASSLEAFINPFLHCAWPRIRSPKSGSMSAWSWLPMSSAGVQLACATCEVEWEGEGP